MATVPFQSKPIRSDRPARLVLLASALLLAVCTIWFFSSSVPNSFVTQTIKTDNLEDVNSTSDAATDDTPPPSPSPPSDLCQDSQEETFYDDPTIGYSIDDKPIKNWDEKRRRWLETRPSLGGEERILLVTGSQPRRCRHPDGDHYLLRLFKNKVDYCRIQGLQLFYSNTFLHPKMKSYWVKLSVIYAAMLAHPESEWIWWVDSDAVFTDMEFALPLGDYKDYNMVVSGWPDDVYKKKSWVGLNTGVFMVRNCQWTMNILREWASMGPISPDFEKWGIIQQSVLTDKMHEFPDDQSALAYLLVTQRKKWGDKVFLEGLYFQTYWPEVSNTFENVTDSYKKMDSSVSKLRRRRREMETTCYVAERERYLAELAGSDDGGVIRMRRRPFVTHFCGCAPCSGNPNSTFEDGACTVGLEKALNFADNQVLRSYGFVHKDLTDLAAVSPLPFDYPRNKIPS